MCISVYTNTNVLCFDCRNDCLKQLMLFSLMSQQSETLCDHFVCLLYPCPIPVTSGPVGLSLCQSALTDSGGFKDIVSLCIYVEHLETLWKQCCAKPGWKQSAGRCTPREQTCAGARFHWFCCSLNNLEDLNKTFSFWFRKSCCVLCSVKYLKCWEHAKSWVVINTCSKAKLFFFPL